MIHCFSNNYKCIPCQPRLMTSFPSKTHLKSTGHFRAMGRFLHNSFILKQNMACFRTKLNSFSAYVSTSILSFASLVHSSCNHHKLKLKLQNGSSYFFLFYSYLNGHLKNNHLNYTPIVFFIR